MWKKLGSVEKSNRIPSRSNLSKDEEPFEQFYRSHKALNDSLEANQQLKAQFCEEYIKRHSSADKHLLLKKSRTESSPSTITLQAKQNGNDLFSLLRSNHHKGQHKYHNNALIADYNAGLMEEQLKYYRGKWQETKGKLSQLKYQQSLLKAFLQQQLNKLKESIKAISSAIKTRNIKRELAVFTALENVKQYRAKEKRMEREREQIMRKYSIRWQNLI